MHLQRCYESLGIPKGAQLTFNGVGEGVGVGGEDWEGLKQVIIRVICVAGGVIGSVAVTRMRLITLITVTIGHARIRGIQRGVCQWVCCRPGWRFRGARGGIRRGVGE